MGSASGPADERPHHNVDLSVFSIERTPVTNRQFAEFLKAKGPGAKTSSTIQTTAMPASTSGAVSGRRTRAPNSCRWLNRHGMARVNTAVGPDAGCRRKPMGKGGERHRRSPLPVGKRPARPDARALQRRVARVRPVGSRPSGASPYPGLLDMAGNAWEWTSSAYKAYPYNAGDGRENPDGEVERSTRGGGQDSGGGEITTTYRGRGLSREPDSGHHNIGFRCAR